MLRVVLCILPSAKGPYSIPSALLWDELMENTFYTCCWLFPGISLCWRGKVKPPRCSLWLGMLVPVELCVGRLWEWHRCKYLGWRKNVAVFSEAAPPPCCVKCESGPALQRRQRRKLLLPLPGTNLLTP